MTRLFCDPGLWGHFHQIQSFKIKVHQKLVYLATKETSVLRSNMCDKKNMCDCTFRRSFKEKCPLSGAKTQVKYVNPDTFLLRRYTVGTYCCVFITLLQKRIEAVQNSNIWGLSLKVNAPSSCKYALHRTQP